MIKLQKKFLCALLAGVMVMGGISVKAFAAEEQPEEPVTRSILVTVTKKNTVYDYVTTTKFAVEHEKDKSASKLYASSNGGTITSNSTSKWTGKYKPLLDQDTVAKGNRYHETLKLLKGTSVTVPKAADTGTYYFTGAFKGNKLIGEVKGISNPVYQVIDYCPGIHASSWTYSNGRS